MNRLIGRFFTTARQLGFKDAISMTASHFWILIRLNVFKPRRDPVETRRLKLCAEINERFGATVHRGPFKGLKLIDVAWWGKYDRAAMLLGLYEQEVLNSISDVSSEYKTFVNLGAADGYYAVGVLVAGIFEKSICFEMNDDGRKVIKMTAELNGASERISINGLADRDFYQKIPGMPHAKCFVLVDIEGGEFDLFDEGVFETMKHSIFVFEIHDYIAGADEKIEKLKADASDTHIVKIVPITTRDLTAFSELKNYHDNDRWLICSEGRPCLMYWMRMDPRSQSVR